MCIAGIVRRYLLYLGTVGKVGSGNFSICLIPQPSGSVGSADFPICFQQSRLYLYLVVSFLFFFFQKEKGETKKESFYDRQDTKD